ncbi:MAG TPA: two-component system response regulator [Ruminococcaceae bacterium]|nr:two-component system response regulator [Oscillospiraceae bacterium]
MKVLALDDERPALAVLEKAVAAALPEAEIKSFLLPEQALEYLQNHVADVIFCDFVMPGMNGIEFGKRVKSVLPKVNIVFVTGYGEYAVETINTLAPQGYIVKPVSKAKIQAVLGNLSFGSKKTGLYVRAFGNFDLFFDGVPVGFKIKKAKELLAYLVDCAGTCTRRELTAVLYEDKEESNAVRYLADAVKCLSETLNSIGAPKVFVRKFNSYSVDFHYFSSDIREYEDGNLNLFQGEYMAQYSWAEYKHGNFL